MSDQFMVNYNIMRSGAQKLTRLRPSVSSGKAINAAYWYENEFSNFFAKKNFFRLGAFRMAEETFKRIDIVINNAGVFDEVNWQRNVDINFVRELCTSI
jgi:hypothetical protein